jgi:hypothetical protein
MNMNRKIFSVCAAMVLNSLLTGCGGGADAVISYSAPASIIKTVAPTPIKKATTVTGGNAVVIHMYQALYGMAPSNGLLLDYAFQANNDASTFVKNLTDRFASTSHADLAKLVLDNLGVTPTTVPAINAKGESEYALLADAVKQLFAAYPTMRGQVIVNMTNLLSGLEGDATYGATAVAYNEQARANLAYSSNTVNSDTKATSSQTVACSVQRNSYGDVPYPAEYLGAFPIPAPTGRLPTSVVRGMAFTDDYPTLASRYPPLNSVCTDQNLYARSIWKEMLNRIQQDGATRVWIYNWTGFDDFTKANWGLSKSFMAMSDSNFQFVVAEAKKRNLEVFYSHMFDYIDLQGRTLAPALSVDTLIKLMTKDDFRKTLDSYHSLIVAQARLAQQFGVAGMQVDWAYPGLMQIVQGQPNYDPEFRTMYLNELSLIIDDIRAVFAGKIEIGALAAPALDNGIAAKIDAISFTLNIGSITAEENKSLTVNFLKNKYKSLIQQKYLEIYDQIGNVVKKLPVIWRVQAQSHYNYYVTGWIGAVFCETDQCIYQKTDYSVQAMGYEAMLEAINEQTDFMSDSVIIDAGYWLTDDMVPRSDGSTGFPNLHQSVRNKPAENIVRYWFGL